MADSPPPRGTKKRHKTRPRRAFGDDDELTKPRLSAVPVARPRQRRNKSAGNSLECCGRGFLFFFLFSRGGEGRGYETGPYRAPLLASCSWLGWLFSYVLSHGPVAESGPQSFAHHVGDGLVVPRSGATMAAPAWGQGCLAIGLQRDFFSLFWWLVAARGRLHPPDITVGFSLAHDR